MGLTEKTMMAMIKMEMTTMAWADMLMVSTQDSMAAQTGSMMRGSLARLRGGTKQARDAIKTTMVILAIMMQRTQQRRWSFCARAGMPSTHHVLASGSR